MSAAFIQQQMEAVKFYLVGGAVRDDLMGLPCKDYDYSVELPTFEHMIEWVEWMGGVIFLPEPSNNPGEKWKPESYETQKKYGVIRARFGKGPGVDFVLCRKDGEYMDGRRPESTEIGTLADDLARRDFTVNAIAQRAVIQNGEIVHTGDYIDPHGGLYDLRDSLLQCVGNPEDRFAEDTLRVIRALRFCITKDLLISTNVMGAIYDTSPEAMAAISFERRKEELTKMFRHNPVASIRLLSTVPEPLVEAMFADGLWMQVTNKAK